MKQNRLNKIMDDIESKEFATEHGKNIHARMSKICFRNVGFVGADDIVTNIKNNPELCEFMGALSHAEVPLAGYINGVFLSRRIDRLYINKNTKKIVVLDYKTDINRNLYREKYRVQLMEYYKLLKQIYPDFNIVCKILWLNDFTLENII